MNKYLILTVILLLSFLVTTATALKPLSDYADNNQNCELVAKEVKNEKGGEMILIMPLKKNGAYDEGAYAGHWVNKLTIHNKLYYIDYKAQWILNSEQALLDRMEEVTGKKYSLYLGNIIYHYP